VAKLTEQFLDLEISSRSDMVAVIDLVFDKALFEPNFGYMYSQLCARCAERFPEFKDEANPDAKPHTFKRLLLNKCQEEFEKESTIGTVLAELPEGTSPEEKEIVRKRIKGRMLGNIRFIGELYKRKMLTEKIMHECLIKLLGEVENPDEDEIECLCKLLTTIGQMIDHARAKPHMDQYFTRMAEMSQNQSLANRLRYMLQETIDLRRGNWTCRKADPKAVAAQAEARRREQQGGRGMGDMRKDAGKGSGKGAGKGAGGKPVKSETRGGEHGAPSASAPAPAPAAPPPPKLLSEDELVAKLEQNLDEFFSGGGLDELVLCTKDLLPRAAATEDVGKRLSQMAMAKGFDARTDGEREKVGRIFGGLFRAKMLKDATMLTLLQETLEFIEDDVVDIPHIATYMSQYIAHAVNDGIIKLSFINKGFAHLVEGERIPAGVMACGVLRALRGLLGDDSKLSKMYADEAELLKCLPPGSTRVDLAKYLAREELAFVDPKLSDDVEKAREEEELGALQTFLSTKLGDCNALETFMDGGEGDDHIWEWIRAHTSNTISVARHVFRFLLEAVKPNDSDSSKKLTELIKRRLSIFKRNCADAPKSEKMTRQLNCLFEVQRYCCNAGWPKDQAKIIFFALYNEDIIEEDAYLNWRDDLTDTTPGKDKALFQVNEFLQWLQTASEDEEEGEEDD